MSRGLSLWLRILGVLALAALAHGPLLAGGHRAPDAALFERAEDARIPRFKDMAAIEPRGGPLAGLAQGAYARAVDWRDAERPLLAWRAGAIGLLIAAAFALGAFARRLFLPWVGAEHAAAAAWATVALGVSHPATTALVANPAAAGELLSLAIGVLAAAMFVRGRQDRALGATAGACGLALVAGFAGGYALLVPPALAFVELVSSHRYRSRRERVRTALNTLFIFGAAVAVGVLMWVDKGGVSRLAEGLASFASAPHAGVVDLAKRASGLAMPANPALGGTFGALAAGAAILLSLQPAVIAARAAPRLWSRMLGWWLLLVACASLYGLDVAVSPAAPTQAALVTLAAFALTLGSAAASTALVGVRRALLPWIVAATWAGLSAAGAWAWRDAAREARELAQDLSAARELYGQDARMLVLDAPRAIAGIETLGDDVGALVPGQTGVTVLTADAFHALAFEPEFQAMRVERLVVIAPRELIGDDAGALREDGVRQAIRLGPGTGPDGQRIWRGIGTWEPGLDTLSCELLTLRADLRSDVAVERRVHWRASEPAVARGSLPCVWIETGDEPVLVAHLGGSLAWILGDRVRRVWFEGGILQVAEARLAHRPEELRDVRPTTDGDDWIFPRVTTPLMAKSLQRGRYVLSLLSLKDHSHVELDVLPFGEDLVRVDGAASAVRDMRRPVAWRLEYRVEGVPLARASGRRIGRDGTVEQ